LENLGFSVQGLTDPRKAIEAFTANPHRFSAVVSDFYMARMSGLDFAREILKRDPKVPVVMVSGYLGDVDKEGLRRAGVRALLPKPAFIDELAPLLSRLLSTPSAA
jgi:CheY-like chemotaxis protein